MHERPSIFTNEMVTLQRLDGAYKKSFHLPLLHQDNWLQVYKELSSTNEHINNVCKTLQ